MNAPRKKPFSRSYVMQLTAKHCMLAIDTSISRTLARIAEFENDPEKSKEVFSTLSSLHALRETLTGFQSENKSSFSDNTDSNKE